MAQVINGVWVEQRHHDVPPRDDVARHVINASVDHLVGVLSQVVVASQGLSEEDQHRMRDFMLACGSLMMARTRLKPDDRQIFERELRAAVANQGGR